MSPAVPEDRKRTFYSLLTAVLRRRRERRARDASGRHLLLLIGRQAQRLKECERRLDAYDRAWSAYASGHSKGDTPERPALRLVAHEGKRHTG
jgi:hypothetical protein